MGKFYVTTPIYYVNDKAHIGHTLTTVLADIIARYKKQAGFDVFFSTGTDEHGLKIKQAAIKAGKTPQKFADDIAKDFINAWKLLNIKYNYFIRTTNPEHKKLAQKFLQKLYDTGHIYKGTYKGLYCIGCEKFLTDSDLNKNKKCPLHKPEQTVKQKEKNYFFKLSKFTPKVKQLISESKYKITPSERKKEILSRIDQGVEDISISREKLDWGIPIPWDKSQTSYVWIEALLNYWTIPQIVKNNKIWPPDLHLVGKEIVWFHAVIWPAILLAAGEKLPKELFVHSFYMIEGQKMSKTLGNVITPKQLLDRYGVDSTRYLLTKSLPYRNDSNITLETFDAWYNAHLANGLGNLVARVAKLCENNKVTLPTLKPHVPHAVEQSGYYCHFDNFQFHLVLEEIWKCIRSLDIEIDKKKPWALSKKEVTPFLKSYAQDLKNIAYALKPFMPKTADKIIVQFSGEIKKQPSLFPRLT